MSIAQRNHRCARSGRNPPKLLQVINRGNDTYCVPEGNGLGEIMAEMNGFPEGNFKIINEDTGECVHASLGRSPDKKWDSAKSDFVSNPEAGRYIPSIWLEKPNGDSGEVWKYVSKYKQITNCGTSTIEGPRVITYSHWMNPEMVFAQLGGYVGHEILGDAGHAVGQFVGKEADVAGKTATGLLGRSQKTAETEVSHPSGCLAYWPSSVYKNYINGDYEWQFGDGYIWATSGKHTYGPEPDSTFWGIHPKYGFTTGYKGKLPKQKWRLEKVS